MQYTVNDKELSASGVTKVSRKGMPPFPWVPSTVNLIAGSMLLICSRNSSLWVLCWITQVSSTNLNQNLGGLEADRGLPSQNGPCTDWQLWGLLVTPWLLPIYIKVNNHSLNRNVGKYHLSHLWDRFLFNIPGLKIDSTQHPLHIHNNGFAQTFPTNSHAPMPTGNSEHSLNSEHVLRDA